MYISFGAKSYHCTWVSRDHGDHLGQTQVITSYYLGQSYHLGRNSITEIRAYETFSDRQPSTSLPDCLTMLPLFVFIWWEDFQKISQKCVVEKSTVSALGGIDDNSTMRGIMKRSVKIKRQMKEMSYQGIQTIMKGREHI